MSDTEHNNNRVRHRTTKQKPQTSWTCEPLNLTENDIKKAFKNAKTFSPSY
jgi:hypothetical protein